MNRFLPPDFQNSVLNISATLAEFLGAPNQNAALPVLREELGRDYRNVVFLCFDEHPSHNSGCSSKDRRLFSLPAPGKGAGIWNDQA